jgi:catechol 2,3-dioxygenase-like lactoylglutathione lyase family enzyme
VNRTAVRWGIVALASATLLAQALDAPPPGLSPVRRTTIATADPEASLRFWRDLLGFTVEYDTTVTDAAQLTLFSPGAREGRAIALRQGAGLGGAIGLFHAPGIAPPGPCEARARAGAVAVLLLTDDLMALRARLAAAGVPILAEPVSYAQSRGPTDAFTVFDPSCVRVAFARIRGEELDESQRR